MRGSFPNAGLAFFVVLAFNGLAAYPLCNALYRCGCAGVWSGGEAACNVHSASGPHCPWCQHRALGTAAFGTTVASQWLVFRAARRRGWRVTRAVLAAMVALVVAGPVVGALIWLPTDYPHFLVLDARRRLRLPDGPLSCQSRPKGTCHRGCCAPARSIDPPSAESTYVVMERSR